MSGTHGPGAARARGPRTRCYARHDRTPAFYRGHGDDGDSRNDPARGSCARCRWFALVHLVLRTSGPGFRREICRADHPVCARRAEAAVQYIGAAGRWFYCGRTGADRGGSMKRRVSCAIVITAIWLLMLGWTAGLSWRTPASPQQRLHMNASDFHIVIGAGVEDGSALRVGAVGDDGNALQSIPLEHLHAKD